MEAGGIRFAAIVALVLPGLLTGACSSPSGDPLPTGKPWSDDFVRALDETESDFVRQVLSDGVVTPVEYAEARQRVIDCMAARGVDATYREDASGFYALDSPASEEARDAQSACQKDWMGSIDSLYIGVKNNPQQLDWHTLVAACLVRNSLAPVGFTGKDLEELEKPLVTSSDELDCIAWDWVEWEEGDFHRQCVEVAASPTPMPTVLLPGGASMDDPEVLECIVNPQH